MTVADPLAPHSLTPRELKELLAAERDGSPFLAYRDGDGVFRIHVLRARADTDAIVVGRREGVPLRLWWDGETSSVHAELKLIGGEWTIVDDGLSRNGTFVNTRAVVGRQRLHDGDRLRIGRTLLVFKAAVNAPAVETTAGSDHHDATELSETQHRILIALCRPRLTRGDLHAPATNQQIADEVFLSVDAVKMQLRTLFGRYGLNELPQNQKRAGLAEFALRVGLVSSRDA